MSIMDKIKSFFSGGGDDSHAGHDHSATPAAPPTPPEPTAPTVPTGPAGMPASEPADEDKPA
jgi:hypothetical protein